MFGCGCFQGYVIFNCWAVPCIVPGFCNFIFQMLQFLCPVSSIVPSGSTENDFLCSLQNDLTEILYLPLQEQFLVTDIGCIFTYLYVSPLSGCLLTYLHQSHRPVRITCLFLAYETIAKGQISTMTGRFFRTCVRVVRQVHQCTELALAPTDQFKTETQRLASDVSFTDAGKAKKARELTRATFFAAYLYETTSLARLAKSSPPRVCETRQLQRVPVVLYRHSRILWVLFTHV